MAENDDPLVGSEEKPAAPSTAEIRAEVQQQLSAFKGEIQTDLGQFGNQLVQGVQQALAQAKEAPENETKVEGDNNAWTALADDPAGFVQQQVAKTIQDQLGPYLATQNEDKFDGLMEKEGRIFDAQFGEGKFAELIRPHVDMVLNAGGGQAMAQVKGSAQQIGFLINQVKGRDDVQEKLFSLKQEKVTKEAEVEATAVMPQGRGPRSNPTKLTADDEALLDDWDDETGIVSDRASALKWKQARGVDGWSISDMPDPPEHSKAWIAMLGNR